VEKEALVDSEHEGETLIQSMDKATQLAPDMVTRDAANV
jgi:hypothetical protein